MIVWSICPNCNRELEVDTHAKTPLNDKQQYVILPIFGICQCGEKYAITSDCDDPDDSVIILDFL